MRGVFFLILGFFWSLCGCAGVTITSAQGKGLIAYAPEPYLLVTPAGTQVLWFPNYQKPLLVNIHPGFGSVNGSVTLTNGWMLTGLGVQADSKIPETITALESPLAAAALLGSSRQQTGTKFGLYHLAFDAKSGLVSKLEGPFGP